VIIRLMHTATAAHFNSNLYVVAATVIPLLLVALMIEGSFAKWIVHRAFLRDLRMMEEADQARAEALKLQTRTRWFRIGRWEFTRVEGPQLPPAGIPLLVLLLLIPLAIIVLGETGAVTAIDHQRASHWDNTLVKINLIGLPIVTAGGAFFAAASSAIVDFRDAKKARAATTEPEFVRSATDSSTDDDSLPEA
jgi:hypothetical protein